MGLLFDDDFGLGSGSMNKMAGNPLVLAGLQMLANGSPQINKIPNTLENVPNVLMTAATTQRKMQDAENERKRQLQEEADKQAATSQALQNFAGSSAGDASVYAKSPVAIQLAIQEGERKKQDEALQSYINKDKAPINTAGVQPQQQPVQPPTAAQPAVPGAAVPDPQAQARQQAISGTASKFDDFGLSSVGKTVGNYAASLGDPQKSAAFMQAAQAQGLTPDSPITGPMLSDPSKGGALARSIGIGADMPDDAFAASHAEALKVSRDRQAARAAAQQQFQQNIQGVAPAAPMVAPQQSAPQQVPPFLQPAPQQQTAPAPQPAPVAPAPQTTTERALQAREAGRVRELEAMIAQEEPHLKSRSPVVSAIAAEKIARYRKEMEKEAPTPDIKEYEYAKLQAKAAGEKDFPSYTQWTRENRKSSATLINTTEGMDAAQTKARITIDTNTAKDVSELAANGRRVLPLVKEVKRLADETPGGYVGQMAPTLAKTLTSMNIPVPDKLSNAELFTSLSMQFLPAIRQPGPVSNYEQQSYLGAVPSLSQSPEGRKKIAGMMEAQIKRNVEISAIYRNYVGSPQLDAKLAELDEKPMYSDEQRADLEAANSKKEAARPSAPASARGNVSRPPLSSFQR